MTPLTSFLNASLGRDDHRVSHSHTVYYVSHVGGSSNNGASGEKRSSPTSSGIWSSLLQPCGTCHFLRLVCGQVTGCTILLCTKITWTAAHVLKVLVCRDYSRLDQDLWDLDLKFCSWTTPRSLLPCQVGTVLGTHVCTPWTRDVRQHVLWHGQHSIAALSETAVASHTEILSPRNVASGTEELNLSFLFF